MNQEPVFKNFYVPRANNFGGARFGRKKLRSKPPLLEMLLRESVKRQLLDYYDMRTRSLCALAASKSG